MPALRDGDFTLWESSAIMQYLADDAADGTLCPRDHKMRAEIARWQSRELVHFNRPFGILSFETVAKPNLLYQPPDAGLVKWSQGEFARYALVLDGALRERLYLVGRGITLANSR